MKTWLCALVLVGSAACKKEKAKAPPPSPVAADAAMPADASMIDAPEIDAAAAVAPAPTPPAGAIAATEAGVGPLNENSKIDVKALKAAFPGFDVKKASISHGGDLKDEHMAVSKGGKLALKIYGDGSPGSIEIVSDEIWNPWGLKIGTTYAEATKVLGPLDCSDAGEHTDWKNYVAECDSEKTRRYGFDFELEGVEAKNIVGKPDKLANAKLVAIRWEAPGQGPPGTE